MELIVVGNYTVGVRETAAWVENNLGNRIGAAFSTIETSGPLKAIVFFPTIFNPEIVQKIDNISYKRSEPSVFMSINIPYGPWMESGRMMRAEMFASALNKGISQIVTSKMVEADRNSLIQAVAKAYQDLRSEFD